MGILSRSLGIQALSVEDPSQPLLPGSVMMESLGLGRSDAGVLVNEAQAMRITTAQVCVKIISEDLASNNHEIFQQMPDASMRLATEHRLWRLIHDEPNPNMSAAVFWGAVGASAVGWGNGYAWIKRDRAARVVSLVPLKSGLTSPVKVNGELMYGTTQTDSGQTAFIDPANILHIPGLTFDGIIGLNPIQTCKNAFGLALAAEKFGALLFGNGARASGVLTHPGVLDPEAYENLKKSVHERSTGNNALSPMILEEGLKWEQISINPNDAQFLATRQFQRTEIAGLWRVPLHLVGDLTRATNNNIEHQSLDYVRYCLRPWAVRIEQEVNRKLLGGPYSMEHNFNDMQRGDFASQTAGYSILRNIGVYHADDILRAMRQNPIGAEAGGEIRTVQGAMINLLALQNPDAADDASTDSGDGAAQPFNRMPFTQIAPAFRSLFRDAVGRTINRSGDKDFTRRAFQPLVSSFTQALLALRFGNVELTKKELALIEAQTNAIADAAPAWGRKDASAIATRLTQQVYTALAGEILG